MLRRDPSVKFGKNAVFRLQNCGRFFVVMAIATPFAEAIELSVIFGDCIKGGI